MSIGQALLPELDSEVATTRRVLAVTPDAQWDWRPHPKSMTLGELASHVAGLVGFVAGIASAPEVDLPVKDGTLTRPAQGNTAEVLAALEANHAAARAALDATTDEAMFATWTLKVGGHTVFAIPRVAALRTAAFSHLIHHRGQLSVYLRLLDVPLPSIYGPSADEKGM